MSFASAVASEARANIRAVYSFIIPFSGRPSLASSKGAELRQAPYCPLSAAATVERGDEFYQRGKQMRESVN
jgi:hypothetical protein